MLGIGICAITFSQGCSREFIYLVYSEKWATESTISIMKAYCIYLMFMSLNGMSEAFAYGLANQKVLNQLQGLLFFNSLLYIGAVVLLSGKFGIIGLIYANCVNMGVRATLSLKISLDSTRDKTSILQIAAKIIKNKVFLGLIALGLAGTIIVKFALNYILVKIYQKTFI